MQKIAVAVIFGFVLGINVASAQGFFNGYLTFDENGTAYIQYTQPGPETTIPDEIIPDPTGRSSVPVLVYELPFQSTTPGDIVVDDNNNVPQEVITFLNSGGNGYVIYYALSPVYEPSPVLGLAGWGTDYADITAPDFNNVLANLAANYQVLDEYSTPDSPIAEGGGVNWVIYTDSNRYTYLFYTDVPEPSTFGLLALGALGLLWRKRS